MLDKISTMLTITLFSSAPLIFAAMGGVICERSGVINIGLEGMMSIGAIVGASVCYFTNNVWLAFLCAGLAGLVLSLIHAVASINIKANQTVSGIAINLVGGGFSVFLANLLFGSATTQTISVKLPNILSVGAFKLNIVSVLALILMLLNWFLLYKTKWGLRIRAVGEHPASVDTLGISVSKLRYICVLLSGLLAGFGGAVMTLSVVSNFAPTVIAGHGFIALAAVIFGKWRPIGTYIACLFFGLANAFTTVYGPNFSIPSTVQQMFPYVLTIIILVTFVGRAHAPKASGIPYEKGIR